MRDSETLNRWINETVDSYNKYIKMLNGGIDSNVYMLHNGEKYHRRVAPGEISDLSDRATLKFLNQIIKLKIMQIKIRHCQA